MGDFEAMIARAKALLKSLNGDAKVALKIDTSGLKDAAAQLAALKAVTKDASAVNADAAKSEYLLAMADRMRANTARDAAKATADLNTATKAATTAAGGTVIWGLTANALHWIISGGAEILAVTLPAMVALGAALAVMAPAAQDAATHMKDLYTATSASNQMFGQTAGDVLGLGHALQTASDAAQPAVYGALGSALEIAKGHMSQFGQTGLQVAQIFQTFAAKVAVDFGPGGSMAGTMNALLSHMVTDLTQIGQVFGNLGHGIASFASQMPGLAEILLGSLAGVLKLASGLVQLAGRFQFMGASILTVFMGFEEFNRWGGLVANTLTKMGLASASLTGGPLSFARMASVIQGLLSVFPTLVSWLGRLAFAAKMPGLAAGLTNMATGMAGIIQKLGPLQAGLVVLAAIGLGILIDKLVTARSAAQQFADSLQQATLKATNLQAFQQIASNIAQINHAMAITPAIAAQLRAEWGKEAWQGAIQRTNDLSAGLKNQEQDLTNVSQGAAYLAKTYGTTLVGGLALADAANVKLANGITGTSAAAQVARVQIASLVAGYEAMGAPLTAVGADMTVLDIQSGLASTKVSQLNQAWDQFMSNLTGGTSGLAQFNQQLTSLTTGTNQVTNVLGKAQSVSLSVKTFAESLKTFSGNGAQAWQNFNQVVSTTAPQLIDWMRTAGAEGALSGKQFTQGVMDMVSALVPLASQSSVAQAEVLGLVHQVAPSITTWGQLTAAIKNSHASLQGLGPIIGDATKAMGNMSQVAQNLGTATQTALLNALSSAKVMASGVGTAMQQYEQALMNGSSNTTSLKQTVIQDFEKMGYTAQQAEQIINAAIAGITSSKTISLTITTTEVTQSISKGGGPPPGVRAPGYASGTGGAAPGWAWVGEAGPELVKFRGGETVVPNHVAAGYAGGTGDAAVHVHVHLDGRQIYQGVQRQSVQSQRRTGHNGMTKRTR